MSVEKHRGRLGLKPRLEMWLIPEPPTTLDGLMEKLKAEGHEILEVWPERDAVLVGFWDMRGDQ